MLLFLLINNNSLWIILFNRTYRSGEITLKTQQFLEELRKNPTLKIMRDELEQLLQEQLEKIGVPPVSLISDLVSSQACLISP